MTVVCTGMIIVLTSLGLAADSGQNDVVQLLPVIQLGTMRYVVGFTTVQQQNPQSQMPSEAYTNFAMG